MKKGGVHEQPINVAFLYQYIVGVVTYIGYYISYIFLLYNISMFARVVSI